MRACFLSHSKARGAVRCFGLIPHRIASLVRANSTYIVRQFVAEPSETIPKKQISRRSTASYSNSRPVRFYCLDLAKSSLKWHALAHLVPRYLCIIRKLLRFYIWLPKNKRTPHVATVVNLTKFASNLLPRIKHQQEEEERRITKHFRGFYTCTTKHQMNIRVNVLHSCINLKSACKISFAGHLDLVETF